MPAGTTPSSILWKWYIGDLVQVTQERTNKLHKQTPKLPIPTAPMPLLKLKPIAHREGPLQPTVKGGKKLGLVQISWHNILVLTENRQLSL